jgi:flagellar basal body-associated protein FliL
MKRKLIIAAVVLLAGGFAAYKTVLAKPAPEPKVHGIAYVLPKEFILNLKDGRFLKLGVGLVVAHDQELEAHGESGAPPDGYGTMPQEALVRAVVTDRLTDASADALIDRAGRHELKEAIAKDLRKHTDVKVEEVLFTDVAVQ